MADQTYQIDITGYELAARDIQQVEANLKRLNEERAKALKLSEGQKDLTEEQIEKGAELTKEIEKEKQNRQDLQRTIKAGTTEVNNQQGAYAKLNAKLADARRKYKDLAAAGQENTNEAKDLIGQISKMDGEVKRIDASMGQHQRNVGNYESALGGLKGGLMNVVGALGLAGGLAGALNIAKQVMISTNEGADRFNETMAGISSATSFLARSLATMDFSNLVNGFKEAYNAGVEYRKSLDVEDDLRVAGELQKKSLDNQITQLRIVAKTNSTTNDERKAALEEIMRLEAEKLKIDKDIADAAVERELKNAEFITGVNREMIVDLIKNQKLYVDAMEDAVDVQKKIQEQSTIWEDAGEGMVYARVDAEKYAAAIAALTPEMQKAIQLVELDKKLHGEKRELIAAAMTEQLNAVGAFLSAEEALIRIENKIENAIKKERLQELQVEWGKLLELTRQAEMEMKDLFIPDEIEVIDAELEYLSQIFFESIEGRKALLQASLNQGVISQQEYAKAIKAIDDEMLQAKQQNTAATLQLAANAVGALGDLLGQNKLLLTAEALMNTYLGASMALTDKTIPNTFARIAAMVVVIASGLKNVANINKIKFAKGGIIGGNLHSQGGTTFYGSDGSAFEAERGELLAIVNRRDTELIGQLGAINSIHGKKFATGGLFVPQVPEGMTAIRQLSMQIRDQRVYVLESDITKKQKHVRVIEQSGQM